MSNVLSLRDNALLEAAAQGLSGEEMEAKYGIPAAQAILRVREILKARDVWSEVEQRKLLLTDLQKVKANLFDRLEGAEDASWASATIRALKEIGNLLDRQAKISDEDMEKVTAAQMRTLLNLITQAFGAAKEALAQDYPDVDVDVIDLAFQTALLEASAS
mgnify:CR=1 FL=1